MKYISTRIFALAIAVGLALFAATWVCAGTTGIVSGTVTNEDGKPLSGANIIIDGTKLTTVTDTNGYFVVTNIAPGDYNLTAEMVGYAKASADHIQVTMDTNAVVDFQMKQEAIQETTAIVTRPRPMIVADQVNTLTLISAGQETMTRTDPTQINTVPGVLSTLPGTNVEPNGSGLPHIRGCRSDQIGYYIEGIPITDPNLGTFSDNLFTTGVGKFQVYTGGFGSEYGNALGCMLNEVKKTGDTNSGIKISSFGGDGAYKSASTEIGGSTPGFNFYASGILQSNDVTGSPWLMAQDYSDNAAKLVFPWKNDTLTILGLQGALQGDLGGAFYPASGDFVRQRYTIAGVDWNHSYGPESFLTVRPYYIHARITQIMTNNYGMYMDQWSDQTGLMIGYTNQVSDKQLVKFGGSLISSDNNNYTDAGGPYCETNVNTFQSALYLDEQLKVASRVTLNGGVRFETINYDRKTCADATESVITPRFGISYAADSRTAWKANWGKYSKFVPACSVEESYFGAGPAISGETSPQECTSGEISFERQVSDTASFRITPFYAEYKRLGDYITDTMGVASYKTIGKGRASGVEFYLRKKVSDNWQGWLSYTYQTIKAGEGNDPLYYTAWDQRHTLAIVTDYKKGIWGHTLRSDFGSGRQDDSAPAGVSRHANPYAIFTYTMSVDMPESSKICDSLTLSLFNIFNNRQAAQYTHMFGPRSSYSIIGERCLSVGFNKTL